MMGSIDTPFGPVPVPDQWEERVQRWVDWLLHSDHPVPLWLWLAATVGLVLVVSARRAWRKVDPLDRMMAALMATPFLLALTLYLRMKWLGYVWLAAFAAYILMWMYKIARGDDDDEEG